MKLSKNINRLVLRSCRIVKIERSQNSLEIVFEYAKLDNLLEEHVSFPVVLSTTTLKIYSPLNEIFKVFYADNEFKIIHFGAEAVKNWIGIEYSDINDEKRTLDISGDYFFDDKKGWAELSIQFEKCELEFETFKPFVPC